MSLIDDAFELVDDLTKQAAGEPRVPVDFAIPEAVIDDIQNGFLASGLSRCECGLPPGSDGCTCRGSVAYWKDHGRLAADLMMNFAAREGLPAKLYGQLGLIHDADYLKHPHDKPSDKLKHPLPLTLKLRSCGIPASVCLAILEHAGYIGQGKNFSSRLSAALSACDDLATLMAILPQADDTKLERLRLDAWRQLAVLPRTLASAVNPPKIMIDSKMSCPTRVLSKPDLYINGPFEQATSGIVFEFSF